MHGLFVARSVYTFESGSNVIPYAFLHLRETFMVYFRISYAIRTVILYAANGPTSVTYVVTILLHDVPVVNVCIVPFL